MSNQDRMRRSHTFEGRALYADIIPRPDENALQEPCRPVLSPHGTRNTLALPARGRHVYDRLPSEPQKHGTIGAIAKTDWSENNLIVGSLHAIMHSNGQYR